ncbi:MAG: HAD family hydrolase [Bacillota bacterium]
MINAVIFDLEGTLVDFQWRLADAEKELRKVLEEFGFDPFLFSSDNYAQIWNKTVKIVSPEYLQIITERLSVIYDHYDQDALSRWSLRQGARDLLSFLQEKKIKSGLVTNVGKKAVKEVLFRFNLNPFFNHVVTRNDTKFMKPCGEGIKTCLKALEIKEDNALFIGDSLSDIAASRKAGLKVAIVKGGESSPEKIMAALPDYFFISLEQAKELF